MLSGGRTDAIHRDLHPLAQRICGDFRLHAGRVLQRNSCCTLAMYTLDSFQFSTRNSQSDGARTSLHPGLFAYEERDREVRAGVS